jgi:hypothetical protein
MAVIRLGQGGAIVPDNFAPRPAFEHTSVDRDWFSRNSEAPMLPDRWRGRPMVNGLLGFAKSAIMGSSRPA